MIQWIVYGMIYLGSALMVYNIYGFVKFAHSVKTQKLWNGNDTILYVPVILLVIFLLGYLTVGIFGKPDLVIAGILFGGSVFVFVVYFMLSSIIKRVAENQEKEARLMAAEEASRAKTSFLATMSHEMRTPMNVILGLDSLALNHPNLPDETRRHLEKIGQSGRHLLGLINNILEMNNSETDRLELKREPFRLADLLEQVNAITQTVCDEKGLNYHFKATGDVSAVYVGDALRVRTILIQLLDNAVKYTDKSGDVSLTAEPVEADDKTARWRFTVSDTGIGMDKDFLPHIFEPFSREDSSATSRYGGGGLSLAVTKNVIDRMGGSISLESRKNVGSTFTVEIPFSVAEAAAPADEAAEQEEIQLAGRRVLVVEDIPENAEIVMDLLELEDVETEHAENGEIALNLFRESENRYYDAVLMDLRMPVMDGLEATRKIRALPREDAKRVPIIALTANTFDSDIRATLDAGMNAHLAKPADADLLYATLKKCIKEAYSRKGDACLD